MLRHERVRWRLQRRRIDPYGSSTPRWAPALAYAVATDAGERVRVTGRLHRPGVIAPPSVIPPELPIRFPCMCLMCVSVCVQVEKLQAKLIADHPCDRDGDRPRHRAHLPRLLRAAALGADGGLPQHVCQPHVAPLRGLRSRCRRRRRPTATWPGRCGTAGPSRATSRCRCGWLPVKTQNLTVPAVACWISVAMDWPARSACA